MQKDKNVTKVIFRMWNDGTIDALMPEIQADYSGNIQSYSHIGQHSAADYNHCIKSTKLASAEQYSKLLIELETIGYNVKVIKKYIEPKIKLVE